MKRILGLDLGTNSIGWALVNTEQVENDKEVTTGIEAAGSRIIPMDAALMGDFEKGNSISQTSVRTGYRGTRRLRERYHLRRERLHRVLDILGFLPEHYSQSFTRYGKFKDEEECKLAWRKDESGSYHFLFQQSFEEMLAQFATKQPELCEKGKKIPYDWTLYYLRKKALSQPLTKQELAWVLLSFNQKRGYYQLRGEEEETTEKDKLVEYYALKVVDIVDTGEKRGKETWYDAILENGMVYPRTALIKPDWIGKIKDFIITTSLEKDGTPKVDKEGNIKRSLRMPGENDWTLLKKKTEKDIDDSRKSVGEYIYDVLLERPDQKIKGKLVRTVERKYYKKELIAILDSQKRFIPELQDRELYSACLDELYGSNDAYRNSIMGRDFTYLFVDDIIFYQRPLKSKKSLIDNCPYEEHYYYDKETGEKKVAHVKCIAKSHPLFQEFRLWQFIQNLKIYECQKVVDGKLRTDVDVTGHFFSTEDDFVKLFDFLRDCKSIKQDVLLGKYLKLKKTPEKKYAFRWNYVEDKEYPCDETRTLIFSGLKKAGVSEEFLTDEIEMELWHILYSVEDKAEIKKAMERFATKHQLDSANFVEVMSALPPFKKEYGSYSAKAIKKLLPLMRMGKYWDEENFDEKVKERIYKIIDGEVDDSIKMKLREKAQKRNLEDITSYSGMPVWFACYVVYGRHSEAKEASEWKTPEDIDRYLNSFKQHSLRNSIVEQVILETMRIVRDIWKKYEKIDEIHVEMGRELKLPADKRAAMTSRISENETTNLRIKALLAEFCNPEFNVTNVRPYSASQQDILRIYEDGVMSEYKEKMPDDIVEILDKFRQADLKKRPSHSEVMRYKMWLDQKYVSPYTGKVIPISRLFTSDYEIEHIIPQSRYFDDSFSNKVICEAEVNKLKDRQLGYEFIKAHHGEKVQLSMGEVVEVLSVEEYEQLVQKTYKGNSLKMKKLLMDDIPDSFIERQLNDSRYISKVIKSLLSNVVREEGEEEAISKNVIACNGAITDHLKRDWGMSEAWNHIILPRFKRLNELTQTNHFTSMSRNGHEIPETPPYIQRLNKKRIDHRHHAMDAIVIACTTRSHVNLLSNESAKSEHKANRYQLSRKLRRYEKVETFKNGEKRTMEVAKEFLLPWPTFTKDVERTLSNIIVSFKQNLRVINKTTNKFQKFNGEGMKVFVHQTKGDNWAIRKSMHKETVFGEVNLRMIKEVGLNVAIKDAKRIVDKDLKKKVLSMLDLGYDLKKMKAYFEENKDTWQDINLKKIKVYYFTKETNDRYFATRKVLGTDTDISKITDTGIQKILRRHLEENGNDKSLAFSPDGIDALNRNIIRLNDGKPHKPIIRVRVFENANKFAVGQKGNKGSKFVEGAKGTNLYFAVYEKESVDPETGLVKKKGRSYATIPFYMAVERQKLGLSPAPETENGNKLLFTISPNDLVYLPTKEDVESGSIKMPLDSSRIYKMVSCGQVQCPFVPYNIASPIYDKKEFGPHNKMERALTGEMIKETCVPLKVDRLGNIIEINGVKI